MRESGRNPKRSGGRKAANAAARRISSLPKRFSSPATSLDALAVGASLAFAGTGIWLPAAAMGIVTALASASGVLLGRKLGTLAGERIMMAAGGTAIVLIGLKILLEHTGIL